MQRDGLGVGEQRPQAGLVGLGVADVAGARLEVLALERAPEHGLELGDELEQR